MTVPFIIFVIILLTCIVIWCLLPKHDLEDQNEEIEDEMLRKALESQELRDKIKKIMEDDEKCKQENSTADKKSFLSDEDILY